MSRARPVALALLAFAAFAAFAGSASGDAIPVRLPGAVQASGVSADGSMRIVVDVSAESGDRGTGRAAFFSKLELVRFDANSNPGAVSVLLPKSTVFDPKAGLLPGGVIVAYSAGSAKRSRVLAFTVTDAGRRSALQTVSRRRRGVSLSGVITNAAGATAILMTQPVAGHGHLERELIAVRPAGASRFGRPEQFGPPGEHPNYATKFAFAPDGSGALIYDTAQVPPTLFRVSVAGRVGPPIPLAARPGAGGVSLAFAPSGTLSLAWSGAISSNTADSAGFALFDASLAAGSRDVTKAQQLPIDPGTNELDANGVQLTPDETDVEDEQLLIAPDGSTVLADIDGGGKAVRVFAGPSGALRLQSSIPVTTPGSLLATFTPAGELALEWTEFGDADVTLTFTLSSGPVAGPFAAPAALLSAAGLKVPGAIALLALPGGATDLLFEETDTDREPPELIDFLVRTTS